MKKFLLSLLTIIAVGLTSAATDYSTGAIPKDSWSAAGTDAELNNISWNISITGSTYLGYDTNSSAKGIQIGSGEAPCTSATISTEGIKGSISKVIVNASIAKSGNCTIAVKVNGTNFLCNNKETASLTTSAAAYTFIGEAEGKIEIIYTNSAKKAVYLKQIDVTYSDGGTPVEPVEPSELTVKYGDTSVSDDDEVSVTEGTEFNISAKDAAKITVTDREDNVLASADANKLTWTPEVMAENIITVTASNEKGNVSTVFSLTVTEKPFTPTDAADVLTVTSFGISGASYGEYTAKVVTAEYKGWVNSNNKNSPSGAAANEIIGMNTSNKGAIVTTTSAGYAVKLSATQWSRQTATDRSLIVYGQDTPYTSCQNLSENERGEMLGEIALEKGVEKSLILAKGYKYIAIMPKGGACQLSEIKIQWASEKPVLPEGGLDFTIGDTSFEIEADAESAEIIVTGVHAESDLYYKLTAAPAETAPESAPRKVADHAGYTKAERNSEGNHAISVSEAGTLELYAYHPATDSKSDVKTITVTKQSDTTAIDAIGADTAEGEAEYFNLQGVRINPENAAPGLYIRCQGGKAAKVLVKK